MDYSQLYRLPDTLNHMVLKAYSTPLLAPYAQAEGMSDLEKAVAIVGGLAVGGGLLYLGSRLLRRNRIPLNREYTDEDGTHYTHTGGHTTIDYRDSGVIPDDFDQS